MKNMKLLAILMSLICALCLGGLVACGGGGGDASGDASGGTEQEAPAPTDEELITADAQSVVGSTISADALLEGFENDESMKKFESMGLDLKGYAENMAKIFKFEIVSVDVDGDTAVAHGKLTLPDFGDKTDELQEKAMEEATKGKDFSNMSQDEQIKIFGEVLNGVLSSPDFPTVTEEVPIDYVKNGDKWEMKDKSAVESLLSGATDTTE